jgi:hypothetical protein
VTRLDLTRSSVAAFAPLNAESHTYPHPPGWTLVALAGWTQVARLALIPWTLVAHTNNQPNNPSNSVRHQSPS